MDQGGQEHRTPMNLRRLELEYLSLQHPPHMGFQRPLLHHHGRSYNSRAQQQGSSALTLTTESRSATP